MPAAQEYDYCHIDIRGDTIDLQAGLRGYAPSSARTELFGVIIASLSNLPLHIGLNNLSVVKKGSRLIAWAQKYLDLPPPGPPPVLRTDGDL